MALKGFTVAVIKPHEFGDLSSISSKIKENKGIYSSTLSKKCNYLICCGTDFAESEKYKKAKRLGIPCVTEKWLDDAIADSSLPDENEYNPDDESINTEAPNVQETQKAGQSQDLTSPKKRLIYEIIDNSLSGWCIYISGKHERSHEQLRKLIEEHGGTVTSTISDKVTHFLGEGGKTETLSQHGATAITEEFLEQAIEVENELSQKSQKSLTPSPKKSRVKKIEKIVRKKIIRGEPFYEVQYVGLDDHHNELLSAEDVIKGSNEAVLKKFEHKYKQEMNSVFSFTNFIAETENTEKEKKVSPQPSPKKKKKSEKGIKASGRVSVKRTAGETKTKISPKKVNPKKVNPKKVNSKKVSPKKDGSKKKVTQNSKGKKRKSNPTNSSKQATKKRKT